MGALLVVGVPADSAEFACSSFSEDFEAAKHYLSWHSYWFDIPLPATNHLTVKVFKDAACTHMAILSMDLIIERCVGREEEVGAGSCSFEQNGLMRCLQSGIRTEVAEQAIHTCSLRTVDIPPWRPSGAGDSKRRILEGIRDYVVTFSKGFGEIESVVCNDFNVRDPYVYAVTTVRTASNDRRRVLFEVRINAKLFPHCWGSRTVEEANWNWERYRVRKIMENPIRISPEEAREYWPCRRRRIQ